jgi:hypothetical protein
MARIPYIDDAIIYQDLGLRGNINLLRIAFQSPKIGEAFARRVTEQLTGLAGPHISYTWVSFRMRTAGRRTVHSGRRTSDD